MLQQKSAAGVVLTRVRKPPTVRVSSKRRTPGWHGASQSASAELYRFRRRCSRNGNLQSGEALVANDDSRIRPARAQLTEPPDADPHIGWCGRGEQVTAPLSRWQSATCKEPQL